MSIVYLVCILGFGLYGGLIVSCIICVQLFLARMRSKFSKIPDNLKIGRNPKKLMVFFGEEYTRFATSDKYLVFLQWNSVILFICLIIYPPIYFLICASNMYFTS